MDAESRTGFMNDVTDRFPASTGSDVVAQLVRNWIETCSTGHEGCYYDRRYRPKRLLALLAGDMLQVIETTGYPNDFYEYTALSHR
jgi:hypothetical protein